MTWKNTLTISSMALGLLLSGPATAQSHDHGEHPHGDSKLQLDNGKKWETDPPLRAAMDTIKREIEAGLDSIHERSFTAGQYLDLAAKIEKQLLSIVTNCKLPPASDAQFHIILGDLFGAVAKMKSESGQRDGAGTIIRGLQTYGDHFEHEGWVPLVH